MQTENRLLRIGVLGAGPISQAAHFEACRKAKKYVGICGQGPSDHPDLAEWLVQEGIESLSLNPDTVVETWLYLARGGKPG